MTGTMEATNNSGSAAERGQRGQPSRGPSKPRVGSGFRAQSLERTHDHRADALPLALALLSTSTSQVATNNETGDESQFIGTLEDRGAS